MNLSPVAKQAFLDNNGNPLVGGLLYTYTSGTTTKVATYKDSAGTLNTNPIVLDYRGECDLWLDPTLTYKFTLAPAGDTDPPTKPIWTVDNISINWLTQSIIGKIFYPKTAAEISAGVTIVLYQYPPLHVFRYGAIGDGNSINATANSVAIQAASDVAYDGGGGIVFFPEGTYCVDAVPHIWNTVSVKGSGRFTSTIKKTTATASTISDATVRATDGVVVGFPICCLHFVHHDGSNNWADASVQDIGAAANTTSPNTTSTVYGFFFRGMSGAQVISTYVNYCQYGYFWANGSNITSEISGNQASNSQYGFVQQFSTSTAYNNNYANKFRFWGHYGSCYYSQWNSNAADNAGATWKVGTAEISIGYRLNGWKAGSFRDNGCETQNGSVWSFSNCLGTAFANNLALDITSNYTGGSDICLLETNGNNDCTYENNRAQTTSVTGTPARHFMWKSTTELGDYYWYTDNLFVQVVTDTTDTSVWANTSGTIVKKTPVFQSRGSYTPTVEGSTTPGTPTYGTRNAQYERTGNVVYIRQRVTWTALGGGAAGNLCFGGLPYASENTEPMPVSVLADSLTFAGQLVAVVRPNSTFIDLYSIATGAAAANLAIDVAATVWITGVYNTP